MHGRHAGTPGSWCFTSALTIMHHLGFEAAAFRGMVRSAAGKLLGLEKKKKTPGDVPLNQKYQCINSNAAAFFFLIAPE